MISKWSVLFAMLTCAVLLVSCSQEENNTAVMTGTQTRFLIQLPIMTQHLTLPESIMTQPQSKRSKPSPTSNLLMILPKAI